MPDSRSCGLEVPTTQRDSERMPAITFRTMGTVVSLRLQSVGVGNGVEMGLAAHGPSEAARLVESVFGQWDEQFSLYRKDSELSRVGRGEIRLIDASEGLRNCYALALHWRDQTLGVFTPHRADGVIDLSGVVKALAIAEAGSALSARGLTNWSINAGGDVLVSGEPQVRLENRKSANASAPTGHRVVAPTAGAVDPEWAVAIVNPADRGDVIASVPLGQPRRAVATSGSAERGEHIWTPHNGDASPFRQVSVFASDIVTADVLATAIVAGGEAALHDLTERFAIDVLVVLRDGQLLATPGLRRTGGVGS